MKTETLMRRIEAANAFAERDGLDFYFDPAGPDDQGRVRLLQLDVEEPRAEIPPELARGETLILVHELALAFFNMGKSAGGDEARRVIRLTLGFEG